MAKKAGHDKQRKRRVHLRLGRFLLGVGINQDMKKKGWVVYTALAVAGFGGLLFLLACFFDWLAPADSLEPASWSGMLTGGETESQQ